MAEAVGKAVGGYFCYPWGESDFRKRDPQADEEIGQGLPIKRKGDASPFLPPSFRQKLH